MNSSVLPRRRFIKTFALSTAFSTLFGKPWRATVLASCDPLFANEIATFKVRLSDYPALENPFGSVRLGVNPVRDEDEPFPDGEYWPLLINRGENGELYVLDAECRHASCVVPAYDEFFFGIRCRCHGSTYAIDGSIVTGPTQFPLRAYPFEFDGEDTLTIHIPRLGFRVNAQVVPAGGSSRLQLSFEACYNATYQLQSRARAQDEWIVTPFARSPNDPASETALLALGGRETIYVDRTSAMAFYAVSMVLSEV